MAEATARAVLVTGASSGIGWGTTRVLTEKGVHVFATVRKAADAQRLTETFAERVTPLLLDVTDEGAVNGAAEQVRTALGGQTLWGLVNNAGVSSAEGPLLHLDTERFRHQLEVNLVAVHTVVRAFAPLLGADKSLMGKPGRIVNISSVGGKNGGPFLGAYVASKHGLEGAEPGEQDVDPGVGPFGNVVPGQSNKRGATPGFDPGYRTLFELIHDLLGDALVQVRTLLGFVTLPVCHGTLLQRLNAPLARILGAISFRRCQTRTGQDARLGQA